MVGTLCCSIDVPAIQTVQVRSARFDSVKHFRPGRLLPPRADMESMTRRARLRRYLLKAFQLDEESWVIFLEVGAYRQEIDNAEKRAARTRMKLSSWPRNPLCRSTPRAWCPAPTSASSPVVLAARLSG